MDSIDQVVLQILQTDNRRSAAEIGAEVGLSVSAVSERVRRLNASGIIAANRSIVDPTRIGLNLCAFLFIDLDAQCDEAAFASVLSTLPEILEAHHITGPHSWLLKVRVRDAAALHELMTDRLKILPSVMRTETLVALHTVKETSELPLPAVALAFASAA